MDTYTCLFGTIIACSFGSFQVLFHWASPVLSRRFCPGFSALPAKKIIEWHSRIVSTLHALVVGTFCLYILWFDKAVNVDPVWGEPLTVQLSIAITTGYLFSDLLLILHYWRDIGDCFFIMHHLSAVYAYYYVLILWVADYGCFAVFCEFPAAGGALHTFRKPKMVPGGNRLPQEQLAIRGDRRRHGGCLLHGAHCSIATLLHEHARHHQISSFRHAWPRPQDLLVGSQHLSRYHEHHLDVQDCTWLLQGDVCDPESSKEMSA
uniref:TLC domain-containing protein 4-B-like isoform X2 n=1 Tax=Myxine glutinosa TaxID=7769 RepID=UPI00358F22BE